MTSVTTVVSLTLLRARQGELLASAFLAKRDIKPYQLMVLFCLYSLLYHVPFRQCVSKRKREKFPALLAETHHSGHTSHYHLLQGTSGCAMARLMSRFANALANANARRSSCLARRSVKLTTVVTPVTITSFKALVGAQWFGLCPVSLIR